MVLQDKIVTWFLQNVIIPRQEIIDKPGFLVTTISEKNQKAYMRDLLLSEGFFEKLEKRVVDQYKDLGRQTLYSAGKKFGYIYAELSRFPQINRVKDRDLENFIFFLVRYIEGTYASDATHELDLKNKTFKIKLKNYIVCRHDGIGLVMTDGGIAGIGAWLYDDTSVEGVQTKCQGRGDDECEVMCASADKLGAVSKSVLSQTDLPRYTFDEEYEVRNRIREATYAKNSFKTMLDNRFFGYEKGILLYKGKRLFLDDSHILFILEKEISQLPNGKEALFEAAFDEGKEIATSYGGGDWGIFITDYLSSNGFGDVAILDNKDPKIGIIYYPWTKFSDGSEYIIIRGFLSGILSQCANKKIILDLIDVTIDEYLTVMIGVK